MAVELIDLLNLVRTSGGSYQMPPTEGGFWLAYAIAIGIRLTIGFVAGFALQQAGQLDGALAALAAGSGATGLFEHAGRGVRPRDKLGDSDEPMGTTE